ncbi:MAG: relaxase, partial [Zoogloeaceae bacterium]|nr:relaxase [Zoogloeaceae bacterium]
AVFNILQDHGLLQPTPDGKAIWKAVVTSDNGWSHSFTLLRLAPALIWESGEERPPFVGTVAQQEDRAENVPADAVLVPPIFPLPEMAAPSKPAPAVSSVVLAKQEYSLNIWTCEVAGPRKSRRPQGLPARAERLALTPADSPCPGWSAVC